LLADLNPGPVGSQTFFQGSRFEAVGGSVVFFAQTAATGWQLFLTDGTPVGTGLLRAGNQETSSIVTELDLTFDFVGVVHRPFLAGDGRGDVLAIGVTDDRRPAPLYTDGTTVGTRWVQSSTSGWIPGIIPDGPAFAGLNSKFVFATYDPSIGLTD